jgi:radical SAM superfamily enzyme
MPLESEDQFGTNSDGSVNSDYCIYCYKDGQFIDDMTLEEYIEANVQYAEQANMTKDEMREHCEKVFPTLKRWKNND